MSDTPIKYPKLPEEFVRSKKLTVKYMVACLKDMGFSYRDMAQIFGTCYSLYGKMKLTPEEARQKRYQYLRETGNTSEYRQYSKKVLKDKILKYRRWWKKENTFDKKPKIEDIHGFFKALKPLKGKFRKNKFSKRLTKRKYPPTVPWDLLEKLEK
jgi:hypothetical protein